MRQIVLILPILLLLISCASTKFSGTAACTGRVCGPHGEPVEQYQVSFGVGLTTVSGINGMFLIPDVRAGTYTVRGGGKGWSSVEKEIEFTDRRGIVCIQVEPMTAVYQKVEGLLRQNFCDEAEKMLAKESVCNDSSPLFQFYREVISYRKSPTEQKLKKIKDKVMEETAYEL
ncbi:MAG: carboxypeptidase regulatory-like domain-containing protein [Treponema sp.]|nr:carboxypeptidase regulatory-like domain-containing protein [Treponema sp.]